MTDLRVDDNFDLQMAEGGDADTVEGLTKVEQNLMLTVTDYFFEEIGDRNETNVVRKLRLEAQRAGRDVEGVTSIQSIEVDNQQGDSLWLDIRYNYDQEFNFQVI